MPNIITLLENGTPINGYVDSDGYGYETYTLGDVFYRIEYFGAFGHCVTYVN